MVEVRWPDSQPVSRQPMAQNGTRCRPLYEARDARICILARQKPETGYVDADWSDRLDEAACRRGTELGMPNAALNLVVCCAKEATRLGPRTPGERG